MKFIGSHDLYKNYTKEFKIDCPLITFDNAIVYDLQDKSYRDMFRLSEIRSGLILHNGEYFFFEHNIVDTPKTSSYFKGSVQSWFIYKITIELGAKIIDEEKVSKWDVVFDNWINTGHFYNYASTDNSGKSKDYLTIDIRKYTTNIIEDTLYGPYGFKPSSMNDGEDIEDFLQRNRLKYSGTKLEINRPVLRDILIKSLI
jgi:hypothetical protein